VTRRRLLALGGAGVTAAALPWALPDWADAATDPYAALRTTWADYLSGGSIDSTNSVYTPAISGLNNMTAAWLAAIDTSSSRTYLWSDLPFGSVSANVTSSFYRLKVMALAYATPGTDYTGSSSLASTITSALDFMVAGPYAATVTPYNNWWDWQIGSSQDLEDAAVLMYSELTSTQISNYCASIDAFVPDPTSQLVVGGTSTTSVGANRLDMCRAVIVRGALGESSTKISAGVADISPALPLVMYGDGLYADGSFTQHSGIAYTGTYGEIFFNDIAALVLLLQGSTWAITDSNLSVIYDGVTNGLMPVVYNGLMIDSVRGRAVSRHLEPDSYDGFKAALTLMLFAQAAASTDATLAATWQETAKGWLQRNTQTTVASTVSRVVNATTGASVTDAATGPGAAGTALAESVLASSSITAASEPTAHHQFPNMARVIHRRSGWAYAIAMSSWQVKRYESINGENLHGWYTGDGMGYLHLDGGGSQFNDAYWDTVNPYLLPGVTADQGAVASAVGEATKPTTRWVGGSVLAGTYGSVGMQLQSYSGLTGYKSWFCLDDEIVCLGAGITSTSGNDIKTCVENRNLHTIGSNALYINGTAQSTSAGWSSTPSGVTSACLTLIAGYCFLGGSVNNATFALTNETGNWYDINDLNPASSTTLVDDTRPYLSIALDHGSDPSGATYAYAILPGYSSAQTTTYAASPKVSVVSNTASIQAITDSTLGVTMANFYAAGTAGGITVSAPASVATQVSGSNLTIAVSDPTWNSATIAVTIAASGYTSIVSTDSTVTALSSSGGSINLLVETGGSRGATHSITLSTSGTALTASTATLLTATANTYVRDGSYASTNYGDETTMVIKLASSGYDRISVLSFDTASITGTVERAILWVSGHVSDSGGNQTSVTAYGLSSTSWTETAVTWNTAPSLGTAYDSGQISTTTDWIALDVTALVKAASSGVANIGLYQESAGLAVILSTNHAGSSVAPTLEIITT
jgi:hyaluronate lyase